MADIRHLRLVLPDVVTCLRQMQQRSMLTETPLVLRTLLQQGALTRMWAEDDLASARLDPWQHSLLDALPTELRTCGLASAALSWRGEGGTARDGTWLQVEPIHLAAGMNDLRLAFPPALSSDEIAQLGASLHPLFSLAGFELQPLPSGNWYLWCERPMDVITYSPRSGFATRLYDIMPHGAHGAELRRLMTEAQMLLHQHPVNMQREQCGILTANSVWFWGAHSLADSSDRVTAAMPRVLSNRAYVQGLCEYLQISCGPQPSNVNALLALEDRDVLVVLSSELLPQLANDWLQPILEALQRGRLTQLDLHLDQWRVTLHGGRYQQWRRYLSRGAHQLTEIST